MLKENKGFSLIEMLIVIAITFIVAGLSVVSFNMANRRRPQQTMDNLVSCAKYSKSLVKANTNDYCMAIMKAADGNYYVIQGNATGSNMSELRTNFKSEAIESSTETKAGTTETQKVLKNVPKYTLAELENDPSKAENYKNLGKSVKIFYAEGDGGSSTSVGNEITQGAQNAVIIKFRKFDGSVVNGSGRYSFSNYRSDTIKCSIVLEKSTGAFHK